MWGLGERDLGQIYLEDGTLELPSYQQHLQLRIGTLACASESNVTKNFGFALTDQIRGRRSWLFAIRAMYIFGRHGEYVFEWSVEFPPCCVEARVNGPFSQSKTLPCR